MAFDVVPRGLMDQPGVRDVDDKIVWRVDAHRVADGELRYVATLVVRSGLKDREKRRVLGNAFVTPEEAALAVARGKRATAASQPLPF